MSDCIVWFHLCERSTKDFTSVRNKCNEAGSLLRDELSLLSYFRCLYKKNYLFFDLFMNKTCKFVFLIYLLDFMTLIRSYTNLFIFYFF